MTPLAKLTIDAHGGLDRWNQFDAVSADLVQGGVLWQLKGQAGTLDDTTVTVGLRGEWASNSPFGGTDRRTRFEPAAWRSRPETAPCWKSCKTLGDHSTAMC